MNIVYLEQVAMMTLEHTKNGGVLIAVARLGAGEKSRESNRRRLYNVREYIKKNVSAFRLKGLLSQRASERKGWGVSSFIWAAK